MSNAANKLLLAAAGNAGEAVYVDDVFSTFLYDGDGASDRALVNGMNLSETGGLIWSKRRSTSQDHYLVDTERGFANFLASNQVNPQYSSGSTGIRSFNTDGYNIGSDNAYNNSSSTYCSWTFLKQEGFFDVVVWDGDGTGAGRVISHNLGSVPGMIIVKSYVHPSGVGNTDWQVYHRQLNGGTNPEQYGIKLNGTGAESSRSWWNNTAPTSTQFTIGGGQDLNGSGGKYVAYLFAHDAQDFGTNSDESIIKCGSYTGNGTAGLAVTLGWEPQWLMIKRSNSTGDWEMVDSMRGISTGGTDPFLRANTSGQEFNVYDYVSLTATGFQLSNDANVNTSGGTYIYVAIRRPHKPASELAATDLFDPVVGQTSGKPNYSSSTGVVDAMFRFVKTSDSGYPQIHNRLTPPNYLLSHNNAVESTTPSPTTKFHFAMNDGWGDNIGGTSTNPVGYMFRRAPGFFDVVTYAGTGSFVWINHNLGVVPEMVWFKGRDYASHWNVFTTQGGTSSHLRLNDHDGNRTAGQSSLWTNLPTATQFRVGSDNEINGSGYDYVAYFFASVDGISKIGTYSGTGSNIDVDCGFSSGARFILIKQVNTSGNWYVWDSANGIVAGNDPFMEFNTTSAQTTNTDLVDPLSSGFTVVADGSAYPLINDSSGTYLFYAIA